MQQGQTNEMPLDAAPPKLRKDAGMHACMHENKPKKIQRAGEPQGGGREKMKKGRLSREEKEYEGQIE